MILGNQTRVSHVQTRYDGRESEANSPIKKKNPPNPNEMITLEVKSDSLIYLIKDCPEEPKLCVMLDKKLKQDVSLGHISCDILGCQCDVKQENYKKALASCERILVANHNDAFFRIQDRYMPKGAKEFKLVPGIYSIPNVEWEEKRSPHNFTTIKEKFEACNHPNCDCVIGRDGELNCNPTLAILKESSPSTEHKFELLRDQEQYNIWWEVLGIMDDVVAKPGPLIPELMKQFTITRKK